MDLNALQGALDERFSVTPEDRRLMATGRLPAKTLSTLRKGFRVLQLVVVFFGMVFAVVFLVNVNAFFDGFLPNRFLLPLGAVLGAVIALSFFNKRFKSNVKEPKLEWSDDFWQLIEVEKNNSRSPALVSPGGGAIRVPALKNLAFPAVMSRVYFVQVSGEGESDSRVAVAVELLPQA